MTYTKILVVNIFNRMLYYCQYSLINNNIGGSLLCLFCLRFLYDFFKKKYVYAFDENIYFCIMKQKKILLIAGIALTLFFSSCMQYNLDRPEVKVDTDKLAAELTEILETDQYYRNLLDTLEMKYPNESDTVQNTFQLMHETDSINLLKIEHILNNYGWPGKDMVGSPADNAAYLVLMHCGNPEVMKKYLPLIKKAVKDNKLLPKSKQMYIDHMQMLRDNRE